MRLWNFPGKKISFLPALCLFSFGLRGCGVKVPFRDTALAAKDKTPGALGRLEINQVDK